MATLLLSVAGSVIGGPIGGSVGALIGQQIDQNILFRPKGREGPRLQDMAVQTSSYGSQIPRIFGKMRVAGTVIWKAVARDDRARRFTAIPPVLRLLCPAGESGMLAGYGQTERSFAVRGEISKPKHNLPFMSAAKTSPSTV